MKVFQAPGANDFQPSLPVSMSAGDVIDRAARLYRRHALALLRIVVVPSLISYAGLIVFSLGLDNFSLVRGDRRVVITVSMILGGGLLYVLGKVVFYAILGGASRSLIDYIFDGRPIEARQVFQTVRQRFWPLCGATLLVLLIVFGFGMVLYLAVSVVLVTYLAFYAQFMSQWPSSILFVLNLVFGLAMIGGVVWVALAVYSRVVYVPQVLMVEGKDATHAISRSFTLAGGELRRIAALVIFWFYIAWSLWLLLLLPLGWYGYWTGMEINPFTTEGPLWYRIAQQTLTQLSEILIAPIAMLGFTMLYLDTRVRKEGFDIELLANRILPPAEYKIVPPPGTTEERPPLVIAPSAPTEMGEMEETVAAMSEAAIVAAPLEEDIPLPAPAAATTVQPPGRREGARVCRWCGTPATMDDRFCSVCGSVF